MGRLLSLEESRARANDVFALSAQQITEELYIDQTALEDWLKSPARVVRLVVDDANKAHSMIVLWITYEADMQKLIRGEIREEQLRPFAPADGGREACALYIAEVIVRKAHDLLRLSYGILKDLEWFHAETGASFDKVYAIAQDKRAEKLVGKLGLKRVGGYHDYTIFGAARAQLPFLGRMLP